MMPDADGFWFPRSSGQVPADYVSPESRYAFKEKSPFEVDTRHLLSKEDVATAVIHQFRPGAVHFVAGDGFAKLNPDGTVEITGTVDEAARAFWHAVAKMAPMPGNPPLSRYSVEELRAELKARGDD